MFIPEIIVCPLYYRYIDFIDIMFIVILTLLAMLTGRHRTRGSGNDSEEAFSCCGKQTTYSC